MNRTMQRTAVIAAALAAVIGGGAALQAIASEPAYAARLIDPASLVVALSGNGAAPSRFAGSASYASSLQTVSTSFAGEVGAAPLFDLAGIAAAVNAPGAAPETFSAATTYADTLDAANLRGASFQLAAGAATTALFDLEGVAEAFAGDTSAEQTQFADESSYADGLREAYLESGFGGESFSGAVTAASAIDLTGIAAAAGGAPTATFADQASYAGSLGAAYMPAGFSGGTFSDEVSAGPVVDLDEVAGATDGPSAAPATFSEVSSYAGSLGAADLNGATFASELAAPAVSPADLFELEALGESLSDGE